MPSPTLPPLKVPLSIQCLHRQGEDVKKTLHRFAFPGFSHVEFKTVLSQGFVLKVAPNEGTAWGTLHSKNREEGKEPLIAQVQVKGQSEAMSP